jgi:O-antigen/teichoic acid export membrane protein
VRHHNQGTQGCESMTHMAPLTRVRSLTRGLLHGGSAGDAGNAKGRDIASNVAVQMAARLTTMALSIITVSLTARTLSPTGYGVWNGAGSYVALFGILTDLGFTLAATQRMAANPEREAEWLGALVIVRTSISLVVMVICAISIPLLLTSADQTHAVAFILTATMITTGGAAVTTVLQSRLRAGLLLSFTVLQGVIWTCVVATLAVLDASVIAFAAASAILTTLVTIFQVRITLRFARIDWRGGLLLWRRLMRIALPLGIASVMITIYYQVDSVLLLQIAGAHESGIYGAAYGFLSPLNFFPAAIMASFFPVLSAVYGSDPDRARRLVQICANSMAVVALPVLAGTIALSGPIINLIYGPDFHSSAEILPILMIAFVAICYGTLAGYLSPLLDLRWRFALYTTVGAVANVILNVALIPNYGAHGSAWATVATEVLTMSLMLFTVLRKLRLRPRVGKITRTVLLAAAMTGVMALSAPLGLLPAGAIGVLVYAVGLLGLRIIDRAELDLLLRRSKVATDLAEAP